MESRIGFALSALLLLAACQTTGDDSNTYRTTTGKDIGNAEPREVSDMYVNLDSADFPLRPVKNTRTALPNRVIFNYEVSGDKHIDEFESQRGHFFQMEIETLYRGTFRFDGDRNVERIVAAFEPPATADEIKRRRIFHGESTKSHYATVKVNDWACFVFSGAFEISARSQMKDPMSTFDGVYCIEESSDLATVEEVAIRDLETLRLRERDEFEF